MTHRFRDRAEAGQRLAQLLAAYADRPDVIILALPRGGVPVAFAVAQALHAPLDILVVRKLGLPGHEELAMGAITTGGVRVLNDEIVDALRIPDTIIERVTAREHAELERRERAYRGGRPAPVLRDQTVMLVDDGLATGTTMRAAIAVVRAQRPAQIIVAVPVAAADSLAALRPLVDALVWVLAPEPFGALGRWYADFAPTTDAEVCELLARGARAPGSTGDSQQVPVSDRELAPHVCLARIKQVLGAPHCSNRIGMRSGQSAITLATAPGRHEALGLMMGEVEQRLELRALKRIVCEWVKISSRGGICFFSQHNHHPAYDIEAVGVGVSCAPVGFHRIGTTISAC